MKTSPDMRKHQSFLTRLRSCRAGAMAVEFAIVAPIFLLMVLGVVEFGRLFYIKSNLQHAVEQTSRYAMVNSGASMASLEAYTLGQLSGMSSTGVTPDATTETVAGTEYVIVTATYTFSFIIPLIPVGDVAVNAKSRVPLIN